MPVDSESSQLAANGWARFGFGVGLLAFFALLALPTPENMRQAARDHFATQLAGDTEVILARLGKSGAPQSSAQYRRAEQVAVEARARTMLSAAAVTVLVACWWISVALPIPATSLVPLVLLPFLSVLPPIQVARAYADPNVFLFLGGFILALAIERWGLHRRIALHIVARIGTGRRTIVLGFMTASALVSMWISNTATTLMMLPLGLAVITAVDDTADSSNSADRANFAAALMLGIAYAASIGGIGTPVGTPPNIVFRGLYRTLFPGAAEVGFGPWIVVWAPVVMIFIPAAWLVLTRVTCPIRASSTHAGRELILTQLRELGRMRRPETLVLIAFAATALLWITRSIPIAEGLDYGWTHLLARWLRSEDGRLRFRADYIDDATIAVGIAVLLFILPADGRNVRPRRRLMDWSVAERLPWGILLLFGGGFAIAAAVQESGLSFWCGQQLARLDLKDPVLLVVATCVLLTFLSEITSNTATTQVMVPIMAELSRAAGVNPLLLMLPATISASLAFMLPVGTPPNAIVFGSGHVQMRQMVRTGFILNLIGVVLVTAAMFWLAGPVLGIQTGVAAP